MENQAQMETDDLVHVLRERISERKQTLEVLDRFTSILYEALEDDLQTIGGEIDTVTPAERRKLPGGRESLQFEWDGRRIVCVPHDWTALPNPMDTDGLAKNGICAGRLTVFLQPLDASTEWAAIYSIYVYPDGEWDSEGGWECCQRQSSMTATVLKAFAREFLSDLTNKLRPMWSARSETDFPGDRGKPQIGFPLKRGDRSEVRSKAKELLKDLIITGDPSRQRGDLDQYSADELIAMLRE